MRDRAKEGKGKLECGSCVPCVGMNLELAEATMRLGSRE
jgi:hypothetical protein